MKDIAIYKEFCRVLNLKENDLKSLELFNKYVEVLMLQKVGA